MQEPHREGAIFAQPSGVLCAQVDIVADVLAPASHHGGNAARGRGRPHPFADFPELHSVGCDRPWGKSAQAPASETRQEEPS
jgi:hypothetical protein